MKIYIVYFRTMVDSPDVTTLCVTTDKSTADDNYLLAKKWEAEYNEDLDEDSGNWAEACMESHDLECDYAYTGKHIFLLYETCWSEEVTTRVIPFLKEEEAVNKAKVLKEEYLKDCPGLVPFDEDETMDESMHLCDEGEQVDLYLELVQTALR